MPATEDHLAAIAHHSGALADVAEGNLAAPVPSCPGWTVADLVAHLSNVHWFWAAIAGGPLAEPPDEAQRPPRAPDDRLVATMRERAAHLVQTLRNADQGAPCWTWAQRQDVGFVTRHQVQEAAVHHWDALAAVGRAADWTMTADLARDAVEEFLTCSVANARWPMEEGDPGLGGTLRLDVADGPSYDVVDGELPGTLSWTAVDDDPARGVAPEQALLWLYRRAEGPGLPDAADPVVARFREMSNTD